MYNCWLQRRAQGYLLQSPLPNAWAKRLANHVSIHSSLITHNIHPFKTLGGTTDSMPNVYPATGLFPS